MHKLTWNQKVWLYEEGHFSIEQLPHNSLHHSDTNMIAHIDAFGTWCPPDNMPEVQPEVNT